MCREGGITEQTYYRWRKEYSGLQVDQARRLKEREQENAKLGKYGKITGPTSGFIKRSDLAWYTSHHHDATGKNVDYAYSYLFGYKIYLPAGASTIKLPVNENIRILGICVADENPAVKPGRCMICFQVAPRCPRPSEAVAGRRSRNAPRCSGVDFECPSN